MKRLFYIIAILCICNLYAQKDSKRKVVDSIRIGFHCGISANNKSNFVKQYEEKILKISSLDEIKKELKFESVKNTSNNFLALIICEALEKRNLIILNEKDKKHIKLFYENPLPIFICEFCFVDTTYSNSLLNDSKNSITQSARNWAKTLIDNRVKQK